MKSRSAVIFYLNGERVEVPAGDVATAGETLAEFLRKRHGLTGTKIVCAEGDCGACTVLKGGPHLKKPTKSVIRGGDHLLKPINSCIALVAQMDGSSLVTVDAVAQEGRLTPVQEAMVAANGSQCGFCTPGFVMALTGLVEKKLCAKSLSAITRKQAQNATTGNLCRCTGYQDIFNAACAIDLSQCESVGDRYVDAQQLSALRRILHQPIAARGEGFEYYAPTSIAQAHALMKTHKGIRLVAGGTDLGVMHNKRKARLTRVMSLHLIPELYRIEKRKSRIRVGARVTLSELRTFMEPHVPEFARFLDLFASPQIKNIATLVGNVANASPIGDTPPFLLVAAAVMYVVGPRGVRKVPLEKFYFGYRLTALRSDEFVSAVEFDVPDAAEKLGLYKVSQRKDLDISAVNAAFRFEWKGGYVARARIALGGVAATPLRLPRTESALEGLTRAQVLAAAPALLQGEISPLSDLRGTSAFRRVIAENLLLKFLRERAPDTEISE